MGNVWAVKVSMELASSGDGWTELSSNGNGAAAAGRVQSPNCSGNSVSACDFATLGQPFPHGFLLTFTNPSNGRSWTGPLTDVGNGSDFGPACGLTPTPAAALGAVSGQVVHITRADGGDLAVVAGFGQLVSGTGGFTGPPSAPAPAREGLIVARYNPSTIIRHDAFVLGEHGRRAFAGANTVRELIGRVDLVTMKGPRGG
jgi:hypothetical protein